MYSEVRISKLPVWVRKGSRATLVHVEALRDYVGVLMGHWPVFLMWLSHCSVYILVARLTFAKHPA